MIMKKRIIGIDYGIKRTGIAISDPFRSFALPIGRIDNSKDNKETIKALLKAVEGKGEIERFVVGLPLLLNGLESDMSKRVREFADILKSETNIEVVLLDERLTSKAAESLLREQSMNRKKRAEVVDTLSASLILETHLSLQ